MFRKIAVTFLSLVVCACTSMVADLESRVQQKFQQMLADKFAERLMVGIDAVVDELAKSGGYLNDPLVRILLPPPIGIVAGVASELKQNPDANLLQTLMNQAAEHAIPVAGPLLKNIITSMDEPTLVGVLNAGNQGASQYLKQHAGEMVQTALLPVITKELNANGAVELYGKLLEAKSKADNIAAKANDVQQSLATAQRLQDNPENVAQERLTQYVAEQAMGGMFRKIAKEELSIRQELQQPKL